MVKSHLKTENPNNNLLNIIFDVSGSLNLRMLSVPDDYYNERTIVNNIPGIPDE